MRRAGILIALAALIPLGPWACDDDDSSGEPSGAGGSAGATSSGGGGGSGLACYEYCGPVVGCSTGVTTEECLTQCLAAPELDTDPCNAAYRARNQCVGALDCAEYELFVNGTGGSPPCAAESAAIVDACAS